MSWFKLREARVTIMRAPRTDWPAHVRPSLLTHQAHRTGKLSDRLADCRSVHNSVKCFFVLNAAISPGTNDHPIIDGHCLLNFTCLFMQTAVPDLKSVLCFSPVLLWDHHWASTTCWFSPSWNSQFILVTDRQISKVSKTKQRDLH